MNDQLTAAPMTAKKRVSIFSPWANMIVSVSPYSSSAKKLYRYYIHPSQSTSQRSVLIKRCLCLVLPFSAL